MEQQLISASLAKRLLALMYDLFILIALSMAYGGVATAVMVNLMGISAEQYRPMQQGIVFQCGWALTIVGFYWFFWKRAGQTVGMRAWRLKLISSKSAPLTHKQCLIRIISAPLSLMLCGLGYLWCLFNKDKAAWHDIISQTRIVALPKKS